MIFLVAYDRQERRLTQPVEEFPAEKRGLARRRRLEVQMSLPRNTGRYEVVLLEADSRKDIEETHARYFFDTKALANQAKIDVDKSGERLREAAKHQSS